MAWNTPKTDWKAADGVSNADMNRIEGNTQYLNEDLTSHKNDNTRHISPNIPATAITFGGKFQIAYNSATNSLDITVVG